jgi:hypothetical protein
MNENERRIRDFEAQRQRNRDDRANQQRKERENQFWQGQVVRQEQLGRQQREAFDRQQKGFDEMARKQAAKNRAEEESRRQAQAGGAVTTFGSKKKAFNPTVFLAFITIGVLIFIFFGRGRLDLTQSGSPQSYAINLIENALDLRNSGPASAKLDDPTRIANEAYEIMVRVLGEKNVVRAATEMQTAKHDKNGDLDYPLIVNGSPLFLDSHDAQDALFAFTALVTSYDDKGYAVGSFLGNWYPQYSLLWREAEQEYQGLVDRYGELAVLAAAKRVREGGSGRIGRLGPEGLPRWKWITRLAENPRLRLPDR